MKKATTTVNAYLLYGYVLLLVVHEARGVVAGALVLLGAQLVHVHAVLVQEAAAARSVLALPVAPSAPPAAAPQSLVHRGAEERSGAEAGEELLGVQALAAPLPVLLLGPEAQARTLCAGQRLADALIARYVALAPLLLLQEPLIDVCQQLVRHLGSLLEREHVPHRDHIHLTGRPLIVGTAILLDKLQQYIPKWGFLHFGRLAFGILNVRQA
jgi:hypothetical protein